MQIGTRVRYGMLAMMDLARRGSAVPARALDIAQAHGLSKGYLEGLLAALRRAGLVRAIRGPGGGWVLARPGGGIRPLEIFNALEGGTRLVPCAEDVRICPALQNARAGAKRCRARSLWVAMGRALEKVLRAETLSGLSGVAPRRKRPAARKQKPKARRKPGKAKPKSQKAKSRRANARKTKKGNAKTAPRAKRAKTPKRAKAARPMLVKAPAPRELRRSA